MSIVCCRILKDKIEIASDSITVRGWTQSKGGKLSKLFQENGLIVGAVGNADELALFNLFCKNHRPERSDESGIVGFLTEFCEWKNHKVDSKLLNNSYIIVCDGRAYCCEQFFVQEITTYQAIGAGMDFALAVLYLGHDVIAAVEAACELSVYCEKPVIRFDVLRNGQF